MPLVANPQLDEEVQLSPFPFGLGWGKEPPNPERSLGQGQGCFSSSLRVDAVSNQAKKSMGSKEGMW